MRNIEANIECLSGGPVGAAKTTDRDRGGSPCSRIHLSGIAACYSSIGDGYTGVIREGGITGVDIGIYGGRQINALAGTNSGAGRINAHSWFAIVHPAECFRASGTVINCKRVCLSIIQTRNRYRPAGGDGCGTQGSRTGIGQGIQPRENLRRTSRDVNVYSSVSTYCRLRSDRVKVCDGNRVSNIEAAIAIGIMAKTETEVIVTIICSDGYKYECIQRIVDRRITGNVWQVQNGRTTSAGIRIVTGSTVTREIISRPVVARPVRICFRIWSGWPAIRVDGIDQFRQATGTSIGRQVVIIIAGK